MSYIIIVINAGKLSKNCRSSRLEQVMPTWPTRDIIINAEGSEFSVQAARISRLLVNTF